MPILTHEAAKTGLWHKGDAQFNIAPADLDAMEANFRLAKRNGIRIPVVWGHSDDARDQAGEVLSLRRAGEALIAKVWIASRAHAIQIATTAMSVSPRIVSSFKDGLGNAYGMFLEHLALVTDPVMPGQQPWTVLQLSTVRFEETPAFDEPWDGDDAERRIRAWATRGDTLDFNQYRRAFAWWDSDNPDALGSYKLPHHDIRNGRLQVNFRGVVAAITALLGGRGGTTIPANEQRAVYNHLARHYRQFDKEPPPFRTEMGMHPPEGTDVEAIIKALNAILAKLGIQPLTAATADELTQQLTALAGTLPADTATAQVASLQAALAAEQAKTKDAAKAAFSARLKDMVDTGRIEPGATDAVTALAARLDYDQAMLDPFAARKPIPTARRTNTATTTTDADPAMTPARAKEIANAAY